MHHYIAFLRGINLGYRRIRMEQLRALFEELKFSDVATFIASGNVIFSSKTSDGLKIEKQIEAHLRESLGYEVDTFVRTRAEVTAIAACRPFAKAELDHPDHTVHAGFWREAPGAETRRKFLACRTTVDELCVKGREYFWLCRINTNESKVWSSPAMRALKLPSSSMRNLTTVRKLAAQYPVSTV
jgi:uncharacterized protein (DUF1697 family)